jgi:exonuclease SbcD
VKILHTADWHLGRQFHGQSLEADHAVILEQVLGAVRTHRPDVLIIAGDIYDRASPPIDAVRQFNGFIDKVASKSRTAIVMIAGNHDSGDHAPI